MEIFFEILLYSVQCTYKCTIIVKFYYFLTIIVRNLCEVLSYLASHKEMALYNDLCFYYAR
jgi:hypothetical protein